MNKSGNEGGTLEELIRYAHSNNMRISIILPDADDDLVHIEADGHGLDCNTLEFTLNGNKLTPV